jgi:hypothetical protein
MTTRSSVARSVLLATIMAAALSCEQSPTALRPPTRLSGTFSPGDPTLGNWIIYAINAGFLNSTTRSLARNDFYAARQAIARVALFFVGDGAIAAGRAGTEAIISNSSIP